MSGRDYGAQRSALFRLWELAGTYGRGPWIPAGEIVAAIQRWEDCAPQAATGALRALRTAGLADRCKVPDGVWWKPTDALLLAMGLAFARHGLLADPPPTTTQDTKESANG